MYNRFIKYKFGCGILNFNDKNFSMLMDFYELTMSNGYFENGMKNQIAYFDMFFRKVPDNGGFVISAGLEQLINYIENLNFTKDDIEFLKSKKLFSDKFLDYLKNFKFSCDVWAVPEGTPVFPNEPIITVKGPIIEAQLIETMLLVSINHQSLIATKTNRIVRASGGRSISEFGSRRAHGASAAVYGARAAYIGGADFTSCIIAEKEFSIPLSGTISHSWVQAFPNEIDAFRAHARTYPDKCVLLVDTYNSLKSGIPNAIKVFREEILPRGLRPFAVRIDSGDITYLSKVIRKMLDDAGFKDCKIIASGSLDEYSILNMITSGAKIDAFGVGERLITSASDPLFCGVYKMCAIVRDGKTIPCMKISEDVTKINNPGVKELWRLYDNITNKAIADVITLLDENIDPSFDYTIFDPENPWKQKTVSNFKPVKIREKIFSNGKLVYKIPSINHIKCRCENELDSLWDEIKRLSAPYKYYVDLSKKLWDKKQDLLIKMNSQ